MGTKLLMTKSLEHMSCDLCQEYFENIVESTWSIPRQGSNVVEIKKIFTCHECFDIINELPTQDDFVEYVQFKADDGMEFTFELEADLDER